MKKQYENTPPRINLANLACALACALALPTAGFARTVYDAGAAMLANVNAASGAYANPYTDENGGVWEYMLTSKATLANTVSLTKGQYASQYGGTTLAGFSYSLTTQAQSIRVNTGGTVTAPSGATLKAGELVLFPGNSDNQCACVTFKAPEAGWYSAFVSAADLQSNNSSGPGVTVDIQAQGHTLLSAVVSVEDVADSTKRLDFQMPVRHLDAGDVVAVVVGRNGSNAGDNTGVTFTVTKEDEGSFYDSGRAFLDNLASGYTNPWGTTGLGTWYCLVATHDDTVGAPANVSKTAVSRLAKQATRASANNQRGFANSENGTSPYVIVNETDSVQSSVAPCELHVHPNASNLRQLITIRFRPPQSGFYTGSIVARDVSRGSDPNANGVDVFLFVGDELVTNAYVSLESFASTALLSFDRRLVATGEPIDVLVSSSGNVSSDATALSIIFRREDDAVYDANASFHDWRAAGNDTLPFPDALGGGATWNLGAKTNATVATQFYQMAAQAALEGQSWQWWLHGSATTFADRPLIAMSAGDVAGFDADTPINSSPLLWYAPREFLSLPNVPGYRSSSPTVRACVPSDGIYRARGNARDLDNNYSADGTTVSDGVAFGISVAGQCVPASAIVFRDNTSTDRFEAAIGAGDLWLRAGETIDFVVDPRTSHYYDPTTLSACYVREGDIPASRVVNIDLGAAGAGKISSFIGRGREGFSDWMAWNALHVGDAATATVENCREADGSTRRNVTVSVERSSGAIAAASGATGCAMLDTGLSSDGSVDTYAFTVSKLVPGAAYTIYAYGTGDAAFTVGGETKGLEGRWLRSDYEPCYARFTATADTNGEIAGAFAAASATGAAFSGLSVVGEFPQYAPSAFTLVIR